jgi:hypothetical protein
MVPFVRRENLPYFGKQGYILPFSPFEQKRKANQDLPGVSDIAEKRKEAQTGLIFL